jgi:hypothetical protein
MLEETLQQNKLQQSHQQGQLQDQTQLIHSQQVVDVKNQQLEAQIARIQQEKAESDSKLSQQNERLQTLEAHFESDRTRELSLMQANTPLHHVDTKVPAIPLVERQTSPELLNSAGGNPTRSDDQTLPNIANPVELTSPPELRNQAAGGKPPSKAEMEPKNQGFSKKRFQYHFTKWIRTTKSIGKPFARKVQQAIKNQNLAISAINPVSITLGIGG